MKRLGYAVFYNNMQDTCACTDVEVVIHWLDFRKSNNLLHKPERYQVRSVIFDDSLQDYSEKRIYFL